MAQVEQQVARIASDPRRGAARRRRVEREFRASHAGVARRLSSSKHGSLRELGRTTLCLFRMLIARDFPLSAGTTALIIATLAYFISPLDLVPDTIAIFGYLDDALLVTEVGILLAADVARFRAREVVTAETASAAE